LKESIFCQFYYLLKEEEQHIITVFIFSIIEFLQIIGYAFIKENLIYWNIPEFANFMYHFTGIWHLEYYLTLVPFAFYSALIIIFSIILIISYIMFVYINLAVKRKMHYQYPLAF